ncbi:MAG: NAD(P)H-binding protein [Wenzhouxiangellaceae bacterium]
MNAPAEKRILIAGATGYIGKAVAAELVLRGHKVTALVRQPTDVPDCQVVVTDLTDPETLTRSLEGASFDVVVSCIASRSGVSDDAWRVDHGANRNLLCIAREAGARQFLLLSAICVQRPKLAFQRAKLAFEAELTESGLDYTIVRPTAFFKSLSGQIQRVRAGKPFLVFGDGTETACKPIGEADLAEFMVDCMENTDARNAILPIGGPGAAITPREQGEMLFELTGMPPKFRSVSPRIFNFAAGLIAPVGMVWPAAARKAELARIGHYYATESMLVWDEDRQQYDAEATPETGRETLRDHYQRMLKHGLAGQELGEQKVF